MTEFLAAAFLVILFSGIAVLLERNHRRTAGLPSAPFGADLEGETDLARVRHDLDVAPPTRSFPRAGAASGRSSRPQHHLPRPRVA